MLSVLTAFIEIEKILSSMERAIRCSVDHWSDCRSTGQVIDPAPGAWFMPKFISLAQVIPGPVLLYSAESWPVTPFISLIFLSVLQELPGTSVF